MLAQTRMLGRDCGVSDLATEIDAGDAGCYPYAVGVVPGSPRRRRWPMRIRLWGDRRELLNEYRVGTKSRAVRACAISVGSQSG